MNTAQRSPRHLTPRFRGQTSSNRSQHITGAVIVATIAVIGTIGTLAPVTSTLGALVFFAVGAGAGYSLSGSV